MGRDTRTAADAPPFWNLPLDSLLASLAATEAGLAPDEAERRRARCGPNTLDVERPRPWLADYLARVRSPLVLLLLAACVVSAWSGDTASAVVIAAIVLVSVTLDFVQERRAGAAARRLRESVALRASVMRGGQFVERPAAELVPGDVVRLAAGDLVPADLRVIDARDFFVRQSALTGEAFPVEKTAADLAAASAELSAATNAAFMGSSVLSGTAHALVCRTGRATCLGEVAGTLRAAPPPTAFERGTRGFGELVVKLTSGLVLFVVMANLLAHRPVADTFLFAVALAVGLTPELLPMIVSVTLARGAQRMAARRVVVKRLSAIEDMGSMDVLCTDKTGTLTQARIRLEAHVDADGAASPRVLQLALVNSTFETGLRSPLDDAIVAAGPLPAGAWTKLDEVPFGFERRRVSVLACSAGERLLVAKGAPEDMLPLCAFRDGNDADGRPCPQPLDDAGRRQALRQFEAFGRDGLRALAIAWRAMPADRSHVDAADEAGLVLAGFVVFLDPPKPDAARALAQLHELGVQVKVVSGDNEAVTRHVCAQVGLGTAQVLTGAQVDALDDAALAVRASSADAFCRVSPAQKSRVLRALQARGHVVGYMGDGVNDAPSLHQADVGISVDDAVDVAREAADLVLLERDLAVLADAVREGRRTFANVMKYVMMATSSNFGNMLSMAAASLVLPFLPLLPVQILLNNLLYDSSEVAIPFDDVDAREVARPHDWDAGYIRRFTLVFGPLSTLFDFTTFGVLHYGFHAGAALFRTGWFIESLVTQVLVIFVLRTRAHPWRSRPHPALAAGAVATAALAVLLPFSPAAPALGFVAPSGPLLAAVGAIALAYLCCAEVAKQAFLRRAGA